MAQYTCSLTLSNGKGTTAWTPDKPAEFSVADQVSFTSTDGDWRVRFADSPFQVVAQIQTFFGQAKENAGSAVVRAGDFPFTCELTVAGAAVPWANGGDDIRVKGK